MRDEITGALAILKRAMQIEQEGNLFYLGAARTTLEAKGQEVYRALADDEQRHFDLIQRQYQSLTRNNRWARSAEIRPAKIDLDRPLFPGGKQALEKAVTARSDDRDALLFGLEIERKSYDLYRTAAVDTASPPGKAMFEFLAGEERGHFDILMMRYDAVFGPVGWQA